MAEAPHDGVEVGALGRLLVDHPLAHQEAEQHADHAPAASATTNRYANSQNVAADAGIQDSYLQFSMSSAVITGL